MNDVNQFHVEVAEARLEQVRQTFLLARMMAFPILYGSADILDAGAKITRSLNRMRKRVERAERHLREMGTVDLGVGG